MTNQQLRDQIEDYKRRMHKNRRLKRVSFAIALCLVAVTIVALVLPAVTLEYGKASCGKEEHAHTEACINRELVCVLPEVQDGHVHVQSCYDDLGLLVCGQAAAAHMHLANCYDAYGQPACGQEEQVHMHTTACISPATGAYVCDTEGLVHVHGETCYALQNGAYVLVCQEPSAGHVHTAICLDENGQPVCGLAEAVAISHRHDDGCYEVELICGMEEHTHTDLCYDEITQSIMKNEEKKAEEAEASDDVNEGEGAESDLTSSEIAEAKAKGLYFENESMIITFDVPDDVKDNLKLVVTENDETVGDDSQEASSQDQADYQADLRIMAFVDDEPVADIESLGITAKLQMKADAINPILEQIDFSRVAPSVKEKAGAKIVVTQQAANEADTPLSELIDAQKDVVVVNDASAAVLSFNLISNEFSASMVATDNPEFTVQYYANIPVFQYGMSDDSIPVIDTNGANLPQNGWLVTAKNLELADDGNGYVPKMQKALTQIYSSDACAYLNQPTMKDFNKLYGEELNYELVEVWVTTDPEAANATSSSEGWEVYTTDHCWNDDEKAWSFTTDPSDSNAICISEGAIVRFVYEPTNGSFKSDVDFFDYDITDGYVFDSEMAAQQGYPSYPTNEFQSERPEADVYANTYEKGINDSINYSGGGSRYAFGNSNTGTGLGDQIHFDAYLNKYNDGSMYPGYQGCNFGMVQGADEEGNLVFNEGIAAPNLFGTDEMALGLKGKTYFSEGSLDFTRVGNTYTLSKASVNGEDFTDLGAFSKVASNGSGESYFTNHFWPMDAATTFGANDHDLKFGALGPEAESNPMHAVTRFYASYAGQGELPLSDDYQDHNAFFGMHYTIQFNLDQDYVGPLDCLFIGDDDVWVFLDGRLVLDLGGVHSTVGEYVNLKDYLPQDDTSTYGNHTLQIFYTERGASTSTCFMNFTLPSTSFKDVAQTTSSLQVSNKVESSPNPEESFDFAVDLVPSNEKDVEFAYTIYSADNSIMESASMGTQQTFSLQSDQRVVIDGIPIGSTFTVTELVDTQNQKGFLTSSTISYKPTEVFANVTSGTIASSESVLVSYTNRKTYELPSTGGVGAYWFWLGGMLLLVLAIVVLRKRSVFSAATSTFSASTHSINASPSGSPESTYEMGRHHVWRDIGHTRKGGTN